MKARPLIVLYAKEDTDFVKQTLWQNRLRERGFGKGGIDCCPLPNVDAETIPALREKTAIEPVFVIIWSAHAVGFWQARPDLVRALLVYHLVHLQLDDAAPLFGDRVDFDMRTWAPPGLKWVNQFSVLSQRRQRPLPLARAAAGGVLAVGLSVGVFFGASKLVEFNLKPATDLVAVGSMEECPSPQLQSRDVSQKDVSLTCTNIQRSPLEMLEEEAWRLIAAERDAARALDAIDLYRAAYSAGRHRDDVMSVEAQHRHLVRSIQGQLVALGYGDVVRSGRVDVFTATALQDFHRRTRAWPHGHIDNLLLETLMAASSSPEPDASPESP
ncbi:MAG: hypothetical protein AAF986_09375 [Pseudomonadota bacterium]